MTTVSRLERVFVWAGGGVFVAALAACAYFFLMTWATLAPDGGGWAAAATNAALFGVFGLHHSLLARETVKRRMECVIPERLLRSIYVWTASLLLLAVLALWRRVGGSAYTVMSWRAYGHAAVQVAGVWLIARSVAKIDALELAGIRPPSTREPLQMTGPYRWVRHPLYLGWLLALFGTAHMTNDRLAFAVITTGYLLLAIPLEERSLVRAFGDAYRRYQQQVPWRVLPYIY